MSESVIKVARRTNRGGTGVKRPRSPAEVINGVRRHECDQPDCNKQFKQAGHLTQHKAFVHGIDVVWHTCDQPDCNKQFKQAQDLTRHKADVHDIDVVWHTCDQPDCNKQFKRAQDLTRHKADVHDIDIVWHTCDQPDCNKQFKQAGHLQRHMRRHHSEVYNARKKVQEERVRSALIRARYDEWFQSETMPPVGYFKREKRIDFRCAKVDSSTVWAQIDFVIGTSTGYVFLEVDEKQHRFGYDAEVSCDMKRMSHVMESIAIELGCDNMPSIYWLRYNPDAWRVDGELQKCPKTRREADLVGWLNGLSLSNALTIGYAFYDTDGGILQVLDNPHFSTAYADVVKVVDFTRIA